MCWTISWLGATATWSHREVSRQPAETAEIVLDLIPYKATNYHLYSSVLAQIKQDIWG